MTQTKRVNISVRTIVSLTVDVEDCGNGAEVVRVVRVNGHPTAREVMEALDAEDGFGELDEVYANAPDGGVQ